MSVLWPSELDPQTIGITVDVEWAHPDVLADVYRLLEDHGIRATLFCTHAGLVSGDHERALHPNFRTNGEVSRQCRAAAAAEGEVLDETVFYRRVLAATKAFAPEAIGSRSHSLFYDSQLIALYRDFGLRYDSSYLLPLVTGLRPVRKECDVLELPIYFNDYFELKTGALEMDPARLDLDTPGLKVLNFHPNLIYTNAPDTAFYERTRPCYHQPDRLRAARHTGRGVRTFLLGVLDRIAKTGLPTCVLAEVDRRYRQSCAGEWLRPTGVS